jgi:hypothetical protein
MKFKKSKITLSAIIIVLSASLSFAGFNDVLSSHSYKDAIEWLQEKGFADGYKDENGNSTGNFGPDDLINRAEFTKILMEMDYVGDPSQITGSDCFPDVKDEWFAKYVCKAKTEEIIDGYPDGTFKPDRNVSFVEAAKIIVFAMAGQNAKMR